MRESSPGREMSINSEQLGGAGGGKYTILNIGERTRIQSTRDKDLLFSRQDFFVKNVDVPL